MSKLIPTVPTSAFWGHLDSFQKDPINLFTTAITQYGNIVQFRLGPPGIHVNFILVNEPKMIREVLQAQQDKFKKSVGYHKIRELLGLGLLTSDGEQWRRERRVSQPYFSQRAADNSIAATVRHTENFIAELRRKAQGAQRLLNVSQWVTQLTLVAAGRAFFNTDLTEHSESIRTTVAEVQRNISRRLMLTIDWPKFAPTPENFRHRRRLRSLKILVTKMITNYKQIDGPETVLDGLLAAHQAGRLTQAEVHDSAITFLLAGHETTANALCWALSLLARDQPRQASLRNEVDSLIKVSEAINGETIGGLKKTRQVILETLRLYPPGWLLDREANEDVALDNYLLPRGSVIAICPYLLHRDDTFWEAPSKFYPERFEGHDEHWKFAPFQYIPFSDGPRNCIGSHFAFIQMQIILSLFLREFKVVSVPPEPVPEPDITLRMKDDLYLELICSRPEV